MGVEIKPAIRHDWTIEEARSLFDLPFNDLLFQAQSIHRRFFDPNQVQVSTLLSIKTGACPEDCKYCPQSGRFDTGLDKEKLLEVDKVVAQAEQAKRNGSTRFCMGAAWRNPPSRDIPYILEMVKKVKALGMETCMTLGMLSADQAKQLADAGLDYYNHNLDTSPEFYGEIITTRTYADRLETLAHVRTAGLKTCCGGIVGMGEQPRDRAGLLTQLANLPEHPQSVPINLLVKVQGTPLEDAEDLDPLEFVRTIAVARIMMPVSHVRLSAGRDNMSDALQALCFLAGANSMFSGDKLLTTPLPGENRDRSLFQKLGITAEQLGIEQNPPCSEKQAAEADVRTDNSDLYYDAMQSH